MENNKQIKKIIVKNLIQKFKEGKLENDSDKKFFIDSCKSIFKLEVEELGYTYKFDENGKLNKNNNAKLDFLNEDSKFQGRLVNPNSDSVLVQLNTNYMNEKLSSDDENVRVKYCKEMCTTIFHEIRHQVQFLITQRPFPSVDGMKYARESVLCDYMQNDFYKDNYESFVMENDAYLKSTEKISSILDESSKSKKKVLKHKNALENSKFYIEHTGRNSKYLYSADELVNSDDSTIEIVDDIICRQKKVKFLENYPILKNEYNSNGTKKNQIELIKDLNVRLDEVNDYDLTDNEKDLFIKSIKESYYELIYRQLDISSKENLKKIKNNFSNEEIFNLLDDMKKYFKDKVEIDNNNNLEYLKIQKEYRERYQKNKKTENNRNEAFYSVFERSNKIYNLANTKHNISKVKYIGNVRKNIEKFKTLKNNKENSVKIYEHLEGNKYVKIQDAIIAGLDIVKSNDVKSLNEYLKNDLEKINIRNKEVNR